MEKAGGVTHPASQGLRRCSIHTWGPGTAIFVFRFTASGSLPWMGLRTREGDRDGWCLGGERRARQGLVKAVRGYVVRSWSPGTEQGTSCS